MNNKVLVSLNSVDIGFDRALIKNFTAQIEAGKVIALTGKNGAGKSCLLKTLCRFIPPRSGTIEIFNKSLDEIELNELAKIIAIVLTEKIQSESLIVREIIELGRSPYTNWLDKKTQMDIDIINSAIELLQLNKIENEYFYKLSDGQKQKVLIAKAIAQTPQILILDEPTTYLDIPSKVDLMKNLCKISTENNIAILMSTHDLFLLKDFVDEVWIVNDENQIIKSDPRQMMEMGQYKKYFGLDLN